MDSNPVGSNENEPKKPQTNFFEDVLFSIIAGCAMLFWDLTTKRLLVGTYRVTTGSGEYKSSEPNPLNICIGVVLALISGIAVGYNMWWIGEAPFVSWAPWAVGTAVFTAVYGWTSVYLLAIKHAFRWSEKLWSYVNIDANHSGARRENGGSNPIWFSRVLMVVATAAVALAALGIVYEVACYVQAHQGGWGWLGWILGAIASIVTVILAVVVVIWVGVAMRSGLAGFFAALVLGGLTWWFWAPVSAIYGGLYHNLTGGDWGAWGYVPGGLVGIIAGAIACWIGQIILWEARLRAVAAIVSLAAVYSLTGYTDALVAQVPLGAFGVVAPVMPWVAYALELLVIGGFLFPIAHIIITHGFSWILDIFDLYDEVYAEARGGYREFFLQVATLAGTGAVIWYGPALVTTFLGLTALWAVWPIVIVVAIFAYIALGKLLDVTGSWPFGLFAGAYAAFETFQYYEANIGFGGWVGSYGSAAVALAATFFVGFPLLYMVVRWLIDRAWLAGLVRDPLVKLHDNVCDAAATIFDELFEAASKTYGDTTAYREVGVHLTNIAIALSVLGGTIYGGFYLGVETWLTFVSAGVATMVSYGVVGKSLLRWGMKPVGYVVGTICGVLFGVFVHGAQPEAWGYYRFIASVVGGLFGAAITQGVLFPWVYVFIRAIINVTSPQKWLRPFLMSMHATYTRFFGQFGRKFMVKYRLFQERFAAARERFAERYAAFQKRFSERNKQ